MLTRSILPSADLSQAADCLLEDIHEWAHACIGRYADTEPTDGHDQLTYTTGWEPYIRARRDDEALSFLKGQRDRVRERFVSTGKWRHGYWRTQEAHHGTEHYELFLGALYRLDPDDPETKRQMLDMAEHLGNWSDDVPPWFDPSTGLFLSYYFGADGVIEDRGGLNLPDHLRCLNIALLAHEMSGDERYLRLARSHAGAWTSPLAGDAMPPIGLLPGAVVRSAADIPPRDPGMGRAYLGFVGDLSQPLSRAENYLASGGLNGLLDLWRLTGEESCALAVERLMDVIVASLSDPDGGPAADMVRRYRRATGRTRYDGRVMDAVASLVPGRIQAISMNPDPRRDASFTGIGKRRDMPEWFEDGQPRRHNPILLAVAAEIADDANVALHALDLARAYLALARESLPDGRHHGCAAGTISAIARGHGRDNNAGMATAVLAPLMDAFL